MPKLISCVHPTGTGTKQVQRQKKIHGHSVCRCVCVCVYCVFCVLIFDEIKSIKKKNDDFWRPRGPFSRSLFPFPLPRFDPSMYGIPYANMKLYKHSIFSLYLFLSLFRSFCFVFFFKFEFNLRPFAETFIE